MKKFASSPVEAFFQGLYNPFVAAFYSALALFLGSLFNDHGWGWWFGEWFFSDMQALPIVLPVLISFILMISTQVSRFMLLAVIFATPVLHQLWNTYVFWLVSGEWSFL